MSVDAMKSGYISYEALMMYMYEMDKYEVLVLPNLHKANWPQSSVLVVLLFMISYELYIAQQLLFIHSSIC